MRTLSPCFHILRFSFAILWRYANADPLLARRTASTVRTDTPSRFPRLSPVDNSDLCVTQIPTRTFAMPYVSTPFRSHARSDFPTNRITAPGVGLRAATRQITESCCALRWAAACHPIFKQLCLWSEQRLRSPVRSIHRKSRPASDLLYRRPGDSEPTPVRRPSMASCPCI